MDELLDVVDAVADIGFEGVIAWTFRLVGLVALLAGLGLWLFTDAGLLFLPAMLIVAGGVALVAPGVLLAFVELAG